MLIVTLRASAVVNEVEADGAVFAAKSDSTAWFDLRGSAVSAGVSGLAVVSWGELMGVCNESGAAGVLVVGGGFVMVDCDLIARGTGFGDASLQLLPPQQLGPLVMEPIFSINGRLCRLPAAAHVFGVTQPCTANDLDAFFTVGQEAFSHLKK